MAIIVNGQEFVTLDDVFYVNGARVVEARLGDGRIVYPQDRKPYGIKIVRPPFRKSYNNGDKISFDGIAVVLLNKDGTIFKDKRYPNGVIPFDELIFPVDTVDVFSERGNPGTYNQWASESFVLGRNAAPGWGSPYWLFCKTQGDVRTVVLYVVTYGPWVAGDPTPSPHYTYYFYTFGFGGSFGYSELRGNEPPPTPEITNMSVCGSPSSVGYIWGIGRGNGIGPWGPPSESYWMLQLGSIAYVQVGESNNNAETARRYAYGDLSVDPSMDVPVQWESPYDGQVFEDEFKIKVGE